MYLLTSLFGYYYVLVMQGLQQIQLEQKIIIAPPMVSLNLSSFSQMKKIRWWMFVHTAGIKKRIFIRALM